MVKVLEFYVSDPNITERVFCIPRLVGNATKEFTPGAEFIVVKLVVASVILSMIQSVDVKEENSVISFYNEYYFLSLP